MKICFLADAPNPHTIKWVNYFANRNYEVHIISFRKKLIPGITFHSVIKTMPIHIDHNAYILTKIGYLSYLNQIKQKVKNINPDILHAHWATSYGLLGAYSGFHPFIISTWGRDIYKASSGSFFYKQIIKFSLNKADIITATSKTLAKETAKFVTERNKEIHTIPFGVDIHQFCPKKSSSKRERGSM